MKKRLSALVASVALLAGGVSALAVPAAATPAVTPETISAMSPGSVINSVNLTWVYQADSINVGAAVSATGVSGLEYRWQAYNLDTKQWTMISDWYAGNWADWRTNTGNYLLNLDVRDAGNHNAMASKAIVFRYVAGRATINGTYTAWQKDSMGNPYVLIGNNAPGAAYAVSKVYDVDRQGWTYYNGAWASWYPKHEGRYWTRFESYTADGRLADEKTYTFAVGLDRSLTMTSLSEIATNQYQFGVDSADPIAQYRINVMNKDTGAWVANYNGHWAQWWAPAYGHYLVQYLALDAEGNNPVYKNVGLDVFPAPAPQPAPAQAPSSAYYSTCDDVRAAGRAPLYRGQPGYSSHLDRDGDGVACEPYRGKR